MNAPMNANHAALVAAFQSADAAATQARADADDLWSQANAADSESGLCGALIAEAQRLDDIAADLAAKAEVAAEALPVKIEW